MARTNSASVGDVSIWSTFFLDLSRWILIDLKKLFLEVGVAEADSLEADARVSLLLRLISLSELLLLSFTLGRTSPVCGPLFGPNPRSDQSTGLVSTSRGGKAWMHS